MSEPPDGGARVAGGSVSVLGSVLGDVVVSYCSPIIEGRYSWLKFGCRLKESSSVSGQNVPCMNPHLCGVQFHRAGTVAACMVAQPARPVAHLPVLPMVPMMPMAPMAPAVGSANVSEPQPVDDDFPVEQKKRGGVFGFVLRFLDNAYDAQASFADETLGRDSTVNTGSRGWDALANSSYQTRMLAAAADERASRRAMRAARKRDR